MRKINVRVVVAAVVFLCGLCGVGLALSSGFFAQKNSGEKKVLESNASFGTWSWDTLARVASEIGAARTEADAHALARQYKIEDEHGTLTSETRLLTTAGGESFRVGVAGVWHDLKEDGRHAGLTLMTLDAVAMRPINADTAAKGGWRDSALRTWLNTDFLTSLPRELTSNIAAVTKRTNSEGAASGVDAVSSTQDKIWLFSSTEVCGDIMWFRRENSDEGKTDNVTLDAILNNEGSQYRAFSQAGVRALGDSAASLVRRYNARPVKWWYRSVYPVGNVHYAYYVHDSGHPYGYMSQQEPAGIVVGFCL